MHESLATERFGCQEIDSDKALNFTVEGRLKEYFLRKKSSKVNSLSH